MNSYISKDSCKTVILAFILFSTLMSISHAQLGEIAGPLNFQVQVGHTETLQWHLINEGNQSVYVQITGPPQLQITSNIIQAQNQTAPTISIENEYGTVQPHSELTVNVTVFMPINNTPNQTSWEGILSAEQVSNETNPGGAVVFSGVAKITSIQAIPSTTTSTSSTTTIAPTATSQSSNNNIPLIIGVIVVLAIVAYALTRKKKPVSKAQARREKMLAAKAAIKGKKAKSATSEEQKLRAERDKLKKQLQALKKSKGSARKSTKKKTRRRRR